MSMSETNEDRGDEPETFHTAGANIGQSRLTRRGFVRAATAGGAAAAVAGGSLSSDQLGASRASASLGAAYQASRVATWLGEEVSGLFGSGADYSGYTGSYSLWQQMEENGLKLASRQEEVLSAMENTVEFSERIGISEGSKAAMEAIEQDKTQTEAETARINAIDSYFADIQEDIVNAHNRTMREVASWYEALETYEAIDGDVGIPHMGVVTEAYELTPDYVDGNSRAGGIFTANHEHNEEDDIYVTKTLIDGREVEFRTGNSNHDFLATQTDIIDEESFYFITVSPSSYHQTETEKDEHIWLRLKNDEEPIGNFALGEVDLEYMKSQSNVSQGNPGDVDNGLIIAYDGRRWANLMERFYESYHNVIDEMGGFESEIYSKYEPEDIDTSQMMTPIDTYESATEDTDHAWRDAALRSLGLDETPDDMEIELHDRGDDGVVVEGSIYALNADLSLETGERYEPEDFEETSLYISYWDDDGNAVEAELDEPFTVLSATDDEGNEIDQVEFEEGPEYDPADVEAIEEELRRQREITEEMLAEQGGGGGGGFWPDDGILPSLGPDLWLTDDSLISGVPNWVPVAGGGAVAYLFGGD